MGKGRVLFVTHDASRSGAPFLLLHLLRWLRENAQFDFEVAVGRSGPLESEFAKLAPVFVFERSAESFARRLVDRIGSYRLQRIADRLSVRRALGGKGFALVYSNTLVNGKLLKNLPDQECPLISHVHELEYALHANTTAMDLEYMLRRTSRFIAASAAVANNLVENHAVARSHIDVVHEFIPVLGIENAQRTEAARRLRAELGIPEEAFVVGAAGSVEWRKGHDLFIPLALDVLRLRPKADIYFVWVGGALNRHTADEIAYDIQKLGLGQRIRFVGPHSNSLDYLAIFDTLCLMSREDPFPLVIVEAAALGKPIICFAASGGSPELVENRCGFVVPYMDVSTMAERIVELLENPAAREELGRRGQSWVHDHNDVGVLAPRIAEIIDRSLATSRSIQ